MRSFFDVLYRSNTWKRRSRAAEPDRYYGDGGTIHSTSHIDVEVDSNGDVVALWYRCMQLPFKTTVATPQRAEEMRSAFAHTTTGGIVMPTGEHTYVTGIIVTNDPTRTANVTWSE